MVCFQTVTYCYCWFKYNVGQKYNAPQVRSDRGSDSWPPDHGQVHFMSLALTTRPSVTSLYCYVIILLVRQDAVWGELMAMQLHVHYFLQVINDGKRTCASISCYYLVLHLSQLYNYDIFHADERLFTYSLVLLCFSALAWSNHKESGNVCILSWGWCKNTHTGEIRSFITTLDKHFNIPDCWMPNLSANSYKHNNEKNN